MIPLPFLNVSFHAADLFVEPSGKNALRVWLMWEGRLFHWMWNPMAWWFCNANFEQPKWLGSKELLSVSRRGKTTRIRFSIIQQSNLQPILFLIIFFSFIENKEKQRNLIKGLDLVSPYFTEHLSNNMYILKDWPRYAHISFHLSLWIISFERQVANLHL